MFPRSETWDSSHLVLSSCRRAVFGAIKTHIVGDGVEGFDRVHEMTEVASNAFGIAMDEQDVARHLAGHLVVDVTSDGTTVGFVSTKHFKTEAGSVLYISGMAIDRRFQGKRIGPLLAKETYDFYDRIGKKTAYIAGRTSNPRVARSRRLYSLGHGVYPIDSEPDTSAVIVARYLYRHLGMTGAFDPRTLVSKDVYQQPMYQTTPLSGDERIDRFFAENVGPRDAVFIIGKPAF